MEHVSADRVHFRLDPDVEPVAVVAPGTEIWVDTLDNEAGRVRTASDPVSTRLDDVNPVTGPIGLQTAEPGDVLRLELLEIRVAPQGHVSLLEGYGLLAGRVKAPRTKIVAIKDDQILFSDRIVLPVRPMVGTIGVAPRDGASSLAAGDHGGNMDNKDLAPGSTLYVRSQVPLGLIYLGDLHAAMGDGEVCLNGIEVAGSVRLRVGLARGLHLSNPMVETPGSWEVVAYDRDTESAIESACEDMAHFLAERLGIDLADAVMLTSVACDVRICQAAPHRASGASVRAVVEKSVLQGVSGRSRVEHRKGRWDDPAVPARPA